MPSPIELLYGTSNQSITITLNSLASAGARASSAIDNTTNLWEEVLVQPTIKSGASGTSATGYVAFYAVATTDGGTTYGEGATGSDAGITLTVPTNAKLIGNVNVVSNATTYKGDPMSVAAAYGGLLPPKFVIIASNQTGHALDASAGGTVTYIGIAHQS